jgi:hypothetical protein
LLGWKLCLIKVCKMKGLLLFQMLTWIVWTWLWQKCWTGQPICPLKYQVCKHRYRHHNRYNSSSHPQLQHNPEHQSLYNKQSRLKSLLLLMVPLPSCPILSSLSSSIWTLYSFRIQFKDASLQSPCSGVGHLLGGEPGVTDCKICSQHWTSTHLLQSWRQHFVMLIMWTG